MDTPECPFDKTILSTRFACRLSHRGQVGERVVVYCTQSRALRRCEEYLDRVRQASRFALKCTDVQQPLPFGQETKVRYGGLLGLQALLDPALGDQGQVDDIDRVQCSALARYGQLDAIPYGEIVKSVVQFENRRRRNPKK